MLCTVTLMLSATLCGAQEVGYNYGKVLFSTWDKKGLLTQLFEENSQNRVKPNVHKVLEPCRQSSSHIFN